MCECQVNTGTCRIQVREEGGEGAPLLLLHFGGGNLMMWERALPLFQGRFRVVRLDLRGHGRSDKPPQGNQVDRMALDVLAVLDELGIPQAHVLGSSLGAEVGLSLAASNPARVLSLCLDGALSSEFGPYSAWQGTGEEFRRHVSEQMEQMTGSPEAVFPSLDALIESRKALFEQSAGWNEYFEAMLRYGSTPLGDGRYTGNWRKHSRDEYMAAYFAYRFEEDYRRVQCPVLMLPGVDDLQDEHFVTAMQGLCGLAVRARIVQVPDWQHPYGWLLQPEPMVEAVLAFLSGVG